MNNYMQRKIAKAKEQGVELFLGQNLYENKKDSIWYDGSICSFTYKNRYEVKVIATGDVRVNINGYVYKFPSLDDLYEYGIKSDYDLHKNLREGKFEWLNNNWFEYSILDAQKNEYITDFLETDVVLDDLDDALNVKNYIDFINLYEKKEKVNNSSEEAKIKASAERKFENLMYQRGLNDFNFDHYSTGLEWLLQNGILPEEAAALGYEEDDINDALDEIKEELKNNDAEMEM